MKGIKHVVACAGLAATGDALELSGEDKVRPLEFIGLHLLSAGYLAAELEVPLLFQNIDPLSGKKVHFTFCVRVERHADTREKNILRNRKARLVDDRLNHDVWLSLGIGDSLLVEHAARHLFSNGNQIL